MIEAGRLFASHADGATGRGCRIPLTGDRLTHRFRALLRRQFMKTFSAKSSGIERKWYVVDAKDRPLGRVAVTVANLLRGKGKTIFSPHIDTGDFVVVFNGGKD